ncbi:TetR family transcriptional regulator [Tamaricihabitans halophyticus]|uniref:TetR family transcriptional regulator n=1 Tax=Tamaricihabitans halophyticus TaxID=1262583 RepID=A0A4R2R3U4_9PSEU|nr:TetR/AcrR family transcriptional regulator [Tamaricihabitans halophyticus]TCP57520.1 TetR family transcriptional regulator [Tamaricihabitans halophyticus]
MPSDATDSFIHIARRNQLVECAIEVIAEDGLAQASTVRIARRAKVSRGVLTYHFHDRAELLDQVITRVYDLGVEFIQPLMAETESPRDALRVFLSGSVSLYAAYPQHLAALTEIFAGERGRDNAQRHRQEESDLAEILRAGQDQGQFRQFDVAVMCETIRRALDGALKHVSGGGAAEPYAAELVTIFDAATRSEGTHGS